VPYSGDAGGPEVATDTVRVQREEMPARSTVLAEIMHVLIATQSSQTHGDCWPSNVLHHSIRSEGLILSVWIPRVSSSTPMFCAHITPCTLPENRGGVLCLMNSNSCGWRFIVHGVQQRDIP